MSGNLRSLLASGQQLFGTMITLPTAATAEILADAGFDWFFIDGEHGPLGCTEILAILQAVSRQVSCVVRVPEASEVAIKRVLDLGAHGIIVPQVNTAEQVEDIVRWAKYAPLGSRGVGLARAHGYGSRFSDYIQRANDEIAVIVQAEHARAVENIESMVQVAGVDAVQLGPYDLSASMGKMGQIDDPEVAAAIDHICQVTKSAGLAIGSFGVTPDAVRADMRRGATLICAGTDTLFLSQSAARMLGKIKATG
jgi:2-keto-3-deoxy-L-rhamnonate aldolase RhmA